MAVPVFPPSILHNPTSAQYEELWNIKSPAPPYPPSSIRPLEAAIASRCSQESACDGNTEERPPINDEFPVSSELYPARAALSRSPDSF